MPRGDEWCRRVSTWAKRGIVATVAAVLTVLFVTWWMDGLADPAQEAVSLAAGACYLSDDSGTYIDRTPRFTGESAEEALAFYAETYGASANLATQAADRDPIWATLAGATRDIAGNADENLRIITQWDGLINAPKNDQQCYISASESINTDVVLVTETCNSLRIFLNETAESNEQITES